MYIPKHFREENPQAIRDFIHSNGFGILVSQLDGKFCATHIPLLLEKNNQGVEVLMGHVSKANPQWQGIYNNEEVLVIFLGQHTYISSSWYGHENVPTWNYQAVHVYGNLKIIEGEAVVQHLDHLINKYENGNEKPVHMQEMSEALLTKEMRGIVVFEIRITDMQAAFKLSQNRNGEDYQSIIRNLEARNDTASHAVAKLMKDK